MLLAQNPLNRCMALEIRFLCPSNLLTVQNNRSIYINNIPPKNYSILNFPTTFFIVHFNSLERVSYLLNYSLYNSG